MKYLLLLISGTVLSLNSFATGDWITYFKNSEVEILYRYSDCNDEINGIHRQKVLLRFVNLTQSQVKVSFAKKLAYSSLPSNPGDVKVYSLVLQPQQTAEGVCSSKDKALFIFSRQLNLNSPQLQKFELINISVNTIE